MSVIYNAEEIFEMGIQIERNGQAFYETASEAAGDNETRKLLGDLARWEETHVTLFADLKKRLPRDFQEDPRLDRDQQKALYLKAAADSHIFRKHQDPKALVKTCKGPIDVLKIAMDFEKDSVVLYTAMKDLVPENLGKGTIDRLIKEEMSHISLIQNWMERFS